MLENTLLKAILIRVFIFDSSIWIDQWRTGRHNLQIDSLAGMIRLSSVVQSELWRGVRKQTESDLLNQLEKRYPIFTPTGKNWLESGRLLSDIRKDHGFEAETVRTLQLDVSVALTARSAGATLITSNRTDFELIRSYRDFDLEVW